jgi:hypothetical protein
MRTTVTLETDVARLLREAMHRSRKNFKQVLNAAIRAGLAVGQKKGPAKPFEVRARPMRLRAGLDPAHLNQLADELEVQAFLEKSRRPGRS